MGNDELLLHTNPRKGSRAIDLGSCNNSFSFSKTFLNLPSRRETSIVSAPLSHQYKLFPTQSTAIPSGFCKLEPCKVC